MKDKAYKVLANQLKVSNSKAKEYIDRGLVYIGNRKVNIARGEVDFETKFSVRELKEPKVIFEDENIIALDKPPFLTSTEIEKKRDGAKLIHRLDKESSGVLILAKNDEFLQKSIREFKAQRVYKEYIAIVEGVVAEEEVINKPILTIKGHSAKSLISDKGKPAKTEIFPLEVVGKKSKIKAVITTGRTHQIRVHLKSINHPIVGDSLYGGAKGNRVLLHSYILKIFDYTFTSKLPSEFSL